MKIFTQKIENKQLKMIKWEMGPCILYKNK